MAQNFEFAGRMVRLRAPLFAAIILALTACETPDLTDPVANANPVASPETDLEPSLLTAFKGGIPFGNFAQPISAFGDQFNGAMLNIAPNYLMGELATIKARGGKVVVMFAGNERHYKTNGYFDLGKWKTRINRYKGINFSSYIKDGTIVGHYMIDEPNDPANWNGKPVSPSVLEEMARYSKQLWPSVVTIVRAEPRYLGSNHRYLDAAWAQYLLRKGSASDYIRRNVADAQQRGLGLVVGMNLLKGGPNGRQMRASEVKDWGSTLLGSSYPCAFVSWTYNSTYLQTTSMKDAMRTLRGKAQNRSTKACRA